MKAFVVRVWMWVIANQEIPLSVLAQYPHKGLPCEISHETGRRQGKEGPRAEQKKTVNRRDQGREMTSRQSRTVGNREQELVPSESVTGSTNVRGWVSIPGGFMGISLEYTLAIAHRMLGKCHKRLPSCSWS